MDRLRNQFEKFDDFAEMVSCASGSPYAFIAAGAIVVSWVCGLPFFGLDAVYQLIINTFTTIVTFLMVFLIQSTQNRSDRAMHLKLDALIRAQEEVSDDLAEIQHLKTRELVDLEERMTNAE